MRVLPLLVAAVVSLNIVVVFHVLKTRHDDRADTKVTKQSRCTLECPTPQPQLVRVGVHEQRQMDEALRNCINDAKTCVRLDNALTVVDLRTLTPENNVLRVPTLHVPTEVPITFVTAPRAFTKEIATRRKK
jgi:hypothetical protein